MRRTYGASPVLALVLLYYISLANAQQSLSSFWGKGFHYAVWQKALVVKSWLYIDGGEIWTGENATVANGTLNNHTLAIDLRTAWNTSSVAPVMNQKDAYTTLSRRPDLFYDPINELVYSMGGISYVANGSNPGSRQFDYNQLTTNYYFDASKESGAVRWFGGSVQVGVVGGQITATSNTTHYSLHGYTSYEYNGTEVHFTAGSMQSFNMENQGYVNETVELSTSSPYTVYGEGQYIPIYGAEGIIVFLGGQEVDFGAKNLTLYPPTTASMDIIRIYDIATKKFLQQKTKGNKPIGRSWFCSAGVGEKHSNGSYTGTWEILVYGGRPEWDIPLMDRDKEDLRSVWILTLPAFVWVKQPNTDGAVPLERRDNHTCALLDGQYMVSVGGTPVVDKELHDPAPTAITDPWSNGLGLFSLADLKWVTDYPGLPVDGRAYTQHPLVKERHNRTTLLSMKWDQLGLEEIFDPKPPRSTTKDDGSSENSKQDVIRRNGIIGGVVGGIALIGIVGLIAFCMHRKKKPGSATSKTDEDEYSKAELESSVHRPVEMGAEGKARAEVDGRGVGGGASEAPGKDNEIHEISSVISPGNGKVYEMA